MFESIFYEIARIAKEFDLSNLINVSEIHAGKVNHTCRADFLIDGWMHSYIVQKVNTYVFRKPVGLEWIPEGGSVYEFYHLLSVPDPLKGSEGTLSVRIIDRKGAPAPGGPAVYRFRIG